MSSAYLKSVVLTETSISSGSRSALWGNSSGDLPKHIHWHGVTFFWPGINPAPAAPIPVSVKFYDGSTSTSSLLILDYRPGFLSQYGTWNSGAGAMMLEDDSYLRIKDGLNIEFTFASGSSRGDAVMTVFYK